MDFAFIKTAYRRNTLSTQKEPRAGKNTYLKHYFPKNNAIYPHRPTHSNERNVSILGTRATIHHFLPFPRTYFDVVTYAFAVVRASNIGNKFSPSRSSSFSRVHSAPLKRPDKDAFFVQIMRAYLRQECARTYLSSWYTFATVTWRDSRPAR